VRNRIARLLGASALLLCVMVPCRAQSGELQTLRVELKTDDRGLPEEYTLELHELHSRRKVDSAERLADGGFILRRVPYGEYQAVIVNGAGNPVAEQWVTVSGVMAPVLMRVAADPSRQRPGGPVSVAQLQHPPTRKAFQAVVSAQRFSEAGDYQKAAEELEKAVRMSPYYAEAYTNLGVQHVRLGRYAQAAEELARALEIGGPNPLVLTNLGSAQIALQQYDAAAQSARAALRLDSAFPQAHLVLGMALSTNTATVQEGLQHLRQAAQSIPRAQLEVDRIQQILR
jgi:tetratricopeptide (TPR) repeat protein